MKGEINRDWYCSAGCYVGSTGRCMFNNNRYDCKSLQNQCGCKHRKHPTPEQFREEYGEDYPDEGAVFVEYNGWTLTSYLTAKEDGFELIVCACTPWGKPPNDWRLK